jgi:hypothetical protein
MKANNPTPIHKLASIGNLLSASLVPRSILPRALRDIRNDFLKPFPPNETNRARLFAEHLASVPRPTTTTTNAASPLIDEALPLIDEDLYDSKSRILHTNIRTY